MGAPPTRPAVDPRLRRAVPIVLAAVLIDTIGFGIAMPVFPRLITGLARVDLEQAARIGGHLLVVSAVMQCLAGPVPGQLGDRFGRRPVLLASMLAFAAGYALLAIAPTIGWLFVGRAVAGVAGAVYSPASAALADLTPPGKRSGTLRWSARRSGLGSWSDPRSAG